MKVHYSARSDVGLKRETNQDSYTISDPQADHDGRLLVVCDGMGGHVAGEVASRIGVETILEHYRTATEHDPAQMLNAAFAEANRRIYYEGRGTMGTTGVAALLTDGMLYVANVGDSRAYLVRNGDIHQLSRDHSLVSDQLAAGIITPEQARVSNIRNIITRALGHQPDVQVDLFPEPLQPGDTVLLSSDGMHGVVEDHEIVAVLNDLSPDQAVERLVEMANDRGGPDNITVVVARVESLGANDDPQRLAQTTPTLGVRVADSAPPGATAASAAGKELPLSRTGMWLAALTLLGLLSLGAFALFSPLPRDGTPVPPLTPAPAVTVAPSTVPATSVASTVAPSAVPALAASAAPPAASAVAPSAVPSPTSSLATPLRATPSATGTP